MMLLNLLTDGKVELKIFITVSIRASTSAKLLSYPRITI